MSCRKIKKLFDAYLEGSIRENEKNDFEEHLLCCPLCSGELKEYKKLISALNSVKETELPENYTETLHRKLTAVPNEEEPKIFTDFVPFFRPVAAGIIFVTILVFFYNFLNKTADRIEKPIPVKNNSIKLNQEGILTFSINSGSKLENVVLEITLPKGICLASASGPGIKERTIYWRGDIEKGNNMISIFVKGMERGSWDVSMKLKNGIVREDIIKVVII